MDFSSLCPKDVLDLVVVLGTGADVVQKVRNVVEDHLDARTIGVTKPEFCRDSTWESQEVVAVEQLSVPVLGSALPAPISQSLLLSVGSPWIVRTDVLEAFGRRAINVHPGRLPDCRGASTTSWGILNRERQVVTTIHELVADIDAGGIIIEEVQDLSPDCRTPNQIREVHSRVTERALHRFFRAVAAGDSLPMRPIDVSSGAYFPPLSTDVHGWINWDWDGADIEAWIYAFSEPYTGSRTTLNGGDVRILHGCFIPAETGHHPYAHGIIVSLASESMRVAVKGGHLVIPTRALLLEVDRPLREGHRFITPVDQLERSLGRVRD